MSSVTVIAGIETVRVLPLLLSVQAVMESAESMVAESAKGKIFFMQRPPSSLQSYPPNRGSVYHGSPSDFRKRVSIRQLHFRT